MWESDVASVLTGACVWLSEQPLVLITNQVVALEWSATLKFMAKARLDLKFQKPGSALTLDTFHLVFCDKFGICLTSVY